jgi:alpha-glucosidase (family GH31 glycosyl hydrolase)
MKHQQNLFIRTDLNRIIFGTVWTLITVTSALMAADPFPGKPPICPRWAFEHWVWEDNVNTRTSAEQLVQGYLDRSIPVSAVILDSPWETAYNTCVFDQTAARYPNAQTMINNFHAKNVKVIMWITAVVNTESPDYAAARAANVGVNNSADISWWKGVGIHIDHTSTSAKTWWHGLLDKVLNMDVDGFKVDQGADYVPAPVITSIGSLTTDVFKKYYYADMFDYTTGKNPQAVTVARAYSAAQNGFGASIAKSPISWQGDFDGDFSGISNQVNDIYTAAQAGYSAPGVEIGGYQGANPTKHSLIRYTQFAALTPLMENGGSNGGMTCHTPWYWDSIGGNANTQTTDIYRYFVSLHNELVPYLFSYDVEASLTGTSILRNTDIPNAQHMLGEEIFVSPLISDVTVKKIIFPASGEWIDYWNDSIVFTAGTTIQQYSSPLNRIPLFIKAGAIIPMNVKTSVTGHGDSTSAGKITMVIYPKATSAFTFHRPTGDGVAYENIAIDVVETGGSVLVKMTGGSAQTYRMRVKRPTPPTAVSGADAWKYDTADKWVIIDKQGANFQVTINPSTKTKSLQQTLSATVQHSLTFALTGNRISLPGELPARTHCITIQDLSGKVLRKKSSDKTVFDIEKDFGIRKGLYIITVSPQ